MEDVKAMVAVFSSDLMKTVLSKLSVRSHAQIVSYWQQKRKEWVNAQQFVTHMGRDCTQTMAVHLNEGGLDTRILDKSTISANLMKHHFTPIYLKLASPRDLSIVNYGCSFRRNSVLHSFSKEIIKFVFLMVLA